MGYKLQFRALKVSLGLPDPVMAGYFDLPDEVSSYFGRKLPLKLSDVDAEMVNTMSDNRMIPLLEMTDRLEIDRSIFGKRRC